MLPNPDMYFELYEELNNKVLDQSEEINFLHYTISQLEEENKSLKEKLEAYQYGHE